MERVSRTGKVFTVLFNLTIAMELIRDLLVAVEGGNSSYPMSQLLSEHDEMHFKVKITNGCSFAVFVAISFPWVYCFGNFRVLYT